MKEQIKEGVKKYKQPEMSGNALEIIETGKKANMKINGQQIKYIKDYTLKRTSEYAELNLTIDINIAKSKIEMKGEKT